MQFNTSRFNPNGLGLQEETINDHFILPHSNEIGLGSSNFLVNNPTIGLHQNENFSQYYPIVGLGQLGLSQRMTDIRRAYDTPYKVQVHTQIDYFPSKNEQTLSMSEVSVTEVVRTQFFKETSSRENIFIPNGTVHIQDRPSFQNQGLNDLYTGNNPFRRPFHQNLQNNCQALDLGRFSDQNDTKREGFYPNLAQVYQALNLRGFFNHCTPKRDEILSPKPISVYAPKTNLIPSGYQIPNHDQLGINFQNLSINKSSSNQTRVSNLDNSLKALGTSRVPSPVRVPSPAIQNDPNDDYNIKDDGRTHSLPTKKYGPYICPKCERIFYTSQCFAAHIGTHYTNESKTERKKRHAARYKKKYLRHFKSPEGFIIVPSSFKMASGMNAYSKGKMDARIKEKGDLKQEQIFSEMAAERNLPYAGMNIKEEPK